MLILSSLALLACAIWLLARIWQDSPLWAILTFLFLPAGLVPLVKHWGSESDIRLPFFLVLALSILQFKLAFDLIEQAGQLEQALEAEILAEEASLAEMANAAQVSDTNTNDDAIASRIRWQRVIDGLSYQHGEMTLRGAKASLALSDNFRFVGRVGVEKVLKAMEADVAPQLLGWVVHQSVNLAKADAWYIEVNWWEEGFLPLRSLAETDPATLWRETQVAAAQLSGIDQAAGYPGFDVTEFSITPRVDSGNDLVYWVERLDFDDGASGLDCHAIKRGRESWLRFSIYHMPVAQLELCLRSIRLVAGSARFDREYRANDAGRFEQRAEYSLVDLISGRAEVERAASSDG